MLFLFNDVVFDLGDLSELLRDGKIPLPPAEIETINPADLVTLVREAVFSDPAVATNKHDQIQHLSALLAYRCPGANAILAVAMPGAESPDQIGVRFANVSITTMAFLWKQYSAGELTAHEINEEVWANVT
ncbi:MAG: hypothetical protein P8P99_01035 [Maricaulis sp.]|jgi:hypothetical protein|nr:hypothetical protein [Maricaulis sp.]